MPENPFYRLAPFIQEFIYQRGWGQLRGIQVDAISAILDTDSHVLIASGTASGKTEAAFLPILTDLYNNPPSSIGAMYIGPLKALINDQFQRLDALLEQTNIPVQSWHGDVSQSKKQKFIKVGRGILQITPESLEAMLIHRHIHLGRLFGDLRYVIIDEVHAFIDSDRGRQVICQLERLVKYQRTPARRIGLSATLGDLSLAAKWLSGNTELSVTTINKKDEKRSVNLGLEYFPKLPNDFDAQKRRALQQDDQSIITALETMEQEHEALFVHMYEMTRRDKKTLIFTNSRGEVEEVTAMLRRIARDKSTDDVFHAHHGSVSAALREAAESNMRDENRPAVTTATITLELGIDLGQLDQVLQLNATHSASSFVQRLGRSGRRGGAAQMFFYSREEVPSDDATLGRRIPWNLLQTIAIIQLYVEERWIEPPVIPRLPFSLLYHQTMSIVFGHTELKPAGLAERVLSLSPFQHVTQDQYRALLHYLLEIHHLEQTEIGGLIIGLEGEKIVNNFRFYATFKDEPAYQVREGSREIGTIQALPKPGDTMALAGFAWKVLEINREKQIIYVERVKGRAPALWLGGNSHLHRRILERMLQILQEDSIYGYLQERARVRLSEARGLARMSGMTNHNILSLGGHRYMILPWCGTKTVETIALLLQPYMRISSTYMPFYIEIEQPSTDVIGLQQQFKSISAEALPARTIAEQLLRIDLEKFKYDRFVSEELLREAIATDHLDVPGAKQALKEMNI